MSINNKNIPLVKFEHDELREIQFELLTIEGLYEKFFQHSEPEIGRVDFYTIFLITTGSGTMMVDFEDYELKNGTILTTSKGQVQQMPGILEMKGWLISFTENFLVKYFDQHETFKRMLLFNDGFLKPTFQLTDVQAKDIEELIKNLRDEYKNLYKDHYKEGILRSLLHVLLMKLERYKQSQAPVISNDLYWEPFFTFKQLVEAECLETRNVADYAAKLGFSTKKLNYITQGVVKKSAKDFIADTFMLVVKRLLITTELSTKELAYKVGFDEPTNFLKFFKRYSGQLPSEFRRSAN